MAEEHVRNEQEPQASRPLFDVRGELTQEVRPPASAAAAVRRPRCVADELSHEVEESPAETRTKMDRTECRKRYHRNPIRAADMPRHRAAGSSQGKVRDDDGDIPVPVEQLSSRGVEDLRRGHGRDDQPVHRELGLPFNRAVGVTEIIGQVGCNPRPHVLREPGCDHDAEDDGRLLVRVLGHRHACIAGTPSRASSGSDAPPDSTSKCSLVSRTSTVTWSPGWIVPESTSRESSLSTSR
jgi:hypothetical protein